MSSRRLAPAISACFELARASVIQHTPYIGPAVTCKDLTWCVRTKSATLSSSSGCTLSTALLVIDPASASVLAHPFRYMQQLKYAVLELFTPSIKLVTGRVRSYLKV